LLSTQIKFTFILYSKENRCTFDNEIKIKMI